MGGKGIHETRPEVTDRKAKKRVKEGRIEITGLFLNSSDLADEASVAASLQPIACSGKQGMPVTAAMQDDINGVPWCLADYLSGCGVGYLSMGQNDSRALKPFDRPTTFWWESPSGNRIMVNRPEHYMWANQLGHTHQWKDLRQCPFPASEGDRGTRISL